MATKLDTINVNTWKRIKFQYVAAVAGAALAISGAIAVAGSPGGDVARGPQVSRTEPSGISISRTVPAPQEVYYFVDSQAQADYAAYVEEVISLEQELINARGPARRAHVLWMATEAEEAAAFEFVRDQSESADGVSFTFIDLRDQ